MTKLLLAAVTLFLSVGTIVEGLRDQKTKKTPRLRGLQDTSTCSFDFSQASSGDSKYDMKVEKNDPSSYLKVTITEGTFKGVYDSWCIGKCDKSSGTNPMFQLDKTRSAGRYGTKTVYHPTYRH